LSRRHVHFRLAVAVVDIAEHLSPMSAAEQRFATR